MFYEVSGGKDKVNVNGGEGIDRFTMSVKPDDNVTVVDKEGNVIFKQGDGGTVITLDNVDQLSVMGQDGQPLFSAAQGKDGYQAVPAGLFEYQDGIQMAMQQQEQMMGGFYGGMGGYTPFYPTMGSYALF